MPVRCIGSTTGDWSACTPARPRVLRWHGGETRQLEGRAVTVEQVDVDGLLALPLLCGAGHALLLAVGVVSLRVLPAARAPRGTGQLASRAGALVRAGASAAADWGRPNR